MSAVRGVDERGYDQLPRIGAPIVIRLAQGLIAIVSVAVLGFAVWVGIRQQTPPDGVITSPTQTTLVSVSTAVTSAPATTVPVATSAETTAPPVTQAATTTVDATVAPATTVAEAVGTARAVLTRPAPLADEPGGTGRTMSRDDGVAITGNVAIVQSRTWLEVNRSGEIGWTEASALEITTTNFAARPCDEIPATIPPNALAYQPGTADGVADGIAWIEQHQSDACSRLVLYLANDLATAQASLSEAFPTGLSIVDLGGRVRVELATDVLVAPEFGLGQVSVGDAEALTIAALRPDGRIAFNIDPGPSRLAVSFLANPARVVLDLVTVSNVAPGVGGGVIVNAQSVVDAASAGDGSTVAITGFARLGDGLGEVALRRAPADGAEQASGLAVEARFDGTPRAGTVTRSWYFYQTPRFDGEWAEFRFSIAGLAPGEYEMFLGLGSAPPDDVENPGLFQLFAVEEPG